MSDSAPAVRDPNAMLLHPDYRDFGSEDKTKADIFPKDCIREGHEHELQKGNAKKLRKGHVVSESILKLIADPAGEVRVLETSYDEAGVAYAPTANHWLLHLGRAARAPAFCGICENNNENIDALPAISQNVDLRRALFEACARNAHHAAWRIQLFDNKLRVFASDPDNEFAQKLPGMAELRPVNERITDLARECLPRLPPKVVPAGTPLERDGHFRHFTWDYSDTPFRVAVSAEVVLQYENDPATRTLAFVNVVPQSKDRDAEGETGWHTTAALSIPLTAPSVWGTLLDNSENSERFETLEHQLLVSNLATRSPDGVCFAPDHFDALSREANIWENGILPNLLANPLPGLTLPIVNVTGHDLGDLAECSFNLFAQPQSSPALELPTR